MTVTGTIINIQRFSIHDGPGIRTTVFFKGCSLRCFWCHNPESIRPKPEIQFYLDRCIGCQDCLAVCEHDAHIFENGHEYLRTQCVVCGECVAICPNAAVELTGRELSVEQVMSEILADKTFYQTSGGGVTLSGGEPMLQRKFAHEVLARCKAEGVHTAIETAANCPWEFIEEMLPVTDMFMMDLKQMDPVKHKDATGVSNELILANARRLAASGKPVLFRIPVIPTVNDADEEIATTAAFVRELGELGLAETNADHGLPQLELLKFHQLASDKYRSLDWDYRAAKLPTLDKSRMQELAAIAEAQGIRVHLP